MTKKPSAIAPRFIAPQSMGSTFHLIFGFSTDFGTVAENNGRGFKGLRFLNIVLCGLFLLR